MTDDDRRHWAFRPLAKVEPPAVTNAGQGRTPIDRFILAGLAAKGLTPAPPADARVLIRRVTFDLTGLPPTPDEVEAFVKAADPDAAYEALVDRLLASPHYGERWGRHWLDVARYADSGGYESDIDRPTAYHYRDFVIKALNDDMPFDEFVRLPVGRGRVSNPDDPRAVAATGFLAAGPSPSPARQPARRGTGAAAVHRAGRHGLDHRGGPARADRRLCPVPRPQVRPDPDAATTTACSPPCTPGTGPRCRSELGPRSNGRTGLVPTGTSSAQAAEDALKKWLDGQRANARAAAPGGQDRRLPITDAEKALLRDKPDSAEAKALAKKHEKALTVTDDEVRKAADDAARKRWDELAGGARGGPRTRAEGPADRPRVPGLRRRSRRRAGCSAAATSTTAPSRSSSAS